MLRILFVIAISAATLLAGFSLPYFKALDFYAILLTVCAGMFVGFAFADGRPAKIIIELIAAAVFAAFTLFGMWKWAWLIPAGFTAFGAWCLIHHYSYMGARVKAWFSPLCAAYAWLVAGFLFLRYFW